MINRDLPQSSVDKTSFFLSYGPDLVSDQSGKEGRGSARRAQKASRKVVRCWSDCKHLERSTSILRLCLKIAWILRVSILLLPISSDSITKFFRICKQRIDRLNLS